MKRYTIDLKTTIFFLALFLGVSKSLLGLDLSKAEPVRMASELIELCSSTDTDRLAFCEGYIDGAMHTWKSATACASQAKSNQSFCAGVKSAQEAIGEAFSACVDCNIASFKPELGDKPIHGQLFVERMREFRNELKSTLGACSPDDHRDEHYCTGYNAEVRWKIANLSLWYSNHAPEDSRGLGLGYAASDVGSHLFGSEEFFQIRPCIDIEVDPQQAKDILLAFVRSNPEQQRDSTGIIILAKALYYGLCPGAENGMMLHKEQCTTWGDMNGRLGTTNTCDKAVIVQFMGNDQVVIEHELSPGDVFDTGLTRSETSFWMFTTCPVGYVSSVPFKKKNNIAIRASEYNCVRK